jgi:hypothetical protein
MSHPLYLTSELEAVNTMLSCINESPVATLAVTGSVDVADALAILSETSRDIQTQGMYFNTDEQYPWYRAPDGTITVGPDVVRVDLYPSRTDLEVVLRGQRLYNKTKRSYVFDEDLLETKTVRLLPWDELPQAARHFIAITASRTFQTRKLGSETKHKFSAEDAARARAGMVREEVGTSDYNYLRGSYSVMNIISR